MSEQPDSQESNHSSRRKLLDFDEMVAILVAFGAIGSILFWGLTRQSGELAWNLGGQTGNQTNATASAPDLFSLGTTASPVPTQPSAAKPSATAGTTGTAQATLPAPVKKSDTDNNLFGAALPAAPAAAMFGAAVAPAITAPPAASSPAAPPAAPAAAPAAPAAPVAKVTEFSDVPSGYWASPFVDVLMKRGITVGSPEGAFRPDEPVTRAEYAALVQKAFEQQETLGSMPFSDVPADFWGNPAIDSAVKKGFMKGYPDGTFAPEQKITRLEVLLSLVNGLGLPKPNNPDEVVTLFQDSPKLPAWAVPAIATAADSNIVVNYPARDQLRPDQPTTRAEVAALIHQALVASGKAESLESEYIVKP
jgi:hypothetical protein